jgi:hypothetical protein
MIWDTEEPCIIKIRIILMDQQEHIHIISAGDSIHKTYPAVRKDLRTVTHTFIFPEKEVFISNRPA